MADECKESETTIRIRELEEKQKDFDRRLNLLEKQAEVYRVRDDRKR